MNVHAYTGLTGHISVRMLVYTLEAYQCDVKIKPGKASAAESIIGGERDACSKLKRSHYLDPSPPRRLNYSLSSFARSDSMTLHS